MSEVLKKKRRAFSLEEKMGILAKVDANVGTRVTLAATLGIPVSTLNTIVKNREEIEKSFHRCGSFSKTRKSTKTSALDEMESILATWFKQARAENASIDGSHLKEEALNIAALLGIDDFRASNGWIDRFKKRHDVVYKSLCCESIASDLGSFEGWKKELPQLIGGYEAKNIFNADETGLFYNFQPGKTLPRKDESSRGGAKSKERITVLLCCNADGSEKLSPLVVGKFKKPQCFGELPTKYENSSNSFVTFEIFEEFLLSLDREMEAKGKHILLFVDRNAAHRKSADVLKNVKVVFFPTNCPGRLRPLHSGIVHSFKCHYRKQLERKAATGLDEGQAGDAPRLRINLLAAIHFVAEAWSRITPETIQNCFAKCGFLECAGQDTRVSRPPDVEGLQNRDPAKPTASDLDGCEGDPDARRGQCVDQAVKEEEEEEEGWGERDSPRGVSMFQALQGLETIRRFLHQFDAEENALETCDKLESELYSLERREACKPVLD